MTGAAGSFETPWIIETVGERNKKYRGDSGGGGWEAEGSTRATNKTKQNKRKQNNKKKEIRPKGCKTDQKRPDKIARHYTISIICNILKKQVYRD